MYKNMQVLLLPIDANAIPINNITIVIPALSYSKPYNILTNGLQQIPIMQMIVVK